MMQNRRILRIECEIYVLIPLSKLHEAALFTDWNLYGRYFAILGEGLPKVLFTNIWVKPADKYLFTFKNCHDKKENRLTTWLAGNEYVLTVVFVKSPPSERADEPFDPEVPKPTWFLEKSEIKYHHYGIIQRVYMVLRANFIHVNYSNSQAKVLLNHHSYV